MSKHLSLFLGVTFVLVILCSLLLTHAAAWNGVRQNGAPWLQSADSGITIQPAIITGTVSFSGDMAYHYALEQCTIGPRPTGTEAGWQTGDYIINVLEEYEWSVTEQMFDYDELAVRNIVGKKGQGPIVLLGAHYDTRPIADKDLETPHEPIIGGNDGASGVAVLLELARVLNETDLKQEIWLTFFDAEDRGHIDGWPYAIGSAYMAAHLQERPQCMVLVDMIGDADQNIFWEANSDPELLQEIWDVAAQLGYRQYFVPQYRWGLSDDHIPFLKQGIPAVDIIDFDYPHWHTTQDTCDQITPASLERVGEILQEWLSTGGKCSAGMVSETPQRQ